jgi:4-amino-4-deoxy-L-arabinose transferase-like glycosyltransferase
MKKLIPIFLIALFLRLYLFRENFPFSAEMGVTFLDIKNIIFNSKSLFVGPATSHPWLHLGPLFYWLFVPFFLLSNFNPVVPVMILIVLSALIVFENYFVVKKIFDEKTALVSSYLVAISPYFIYHAKVAQYYSLVLVFFYPFLYFIYSNWLWAGIFLGIILNFHLSAVILIPGSLIFMAIRGQFTKINLFKFMFGVLVFQFLFVIYNLEFLIWLPYRVATYAIFFDLPQTLITFFLSTFVPYGNFFPH